MPPPAPLSVTVQMNGAQVADVNRLLAHIPRVIPMALSAAVNDTGRWVQSQSRRGVVKEINITLAATKRFFKLRLGSPGMPVAQVSITGSRMRLTELAARQTRRGATYMIRRSGGGGGRKVVAIGFIAKARNDPREHVWKRLGKPRYPIQPLFGPSIPQVAIDSPDLQKLFTVDASGRLEKNLGRQIDRFLKVQNPAEESAGRDDA